MKKMALNEYARMKKKSIFAVVKEIQSGKLQSIEEETDGIKKRFVLISESESSQTENDKTETQISSLSLEDEIKILRDEIEALKKIIESCCKDDRSQR